MAFYNRQGNLADFFDKGKIMKNIIKNTAIFTFLFLLVGAFSLNISAQTKREILIVADQKASCTGVAPMSCLQVKKLSEEKFSLMYENIQKFNYTPGNYYVLDVRVSPVANPPADGSKYSYRLNKVLAVVKSKNSDPVELPNPPAAQNLSGIEWQLIKINNQDVGKTRAFIKFDESKNSVGGNGGCNGFGGKLEKNGNKIKLSQIFSTKMFCESGSEIESKFLGGLERVTTYSVTKDRLILRAGDETILAFEKRK